jgi:hypothetical protein
MRIPDSDADTLNNKLNYILTVKRITGIGCEYFVG